MKKIKPELKEKILKLTSIFETSGNWGAVAGNFDGQILSYGPLQWNLGQKTLQRILKLIPKDVLTKYLGNDFVDALYNNTIESFVIKNVLSVDGRVKKEWTKKFNDLAKEQVVKDIFILGAENYFKKAKSLCEALGFETERGLALCFDTAVQNGAPRKDHINEYNKRLAQTKLSQEWEKLKLFATVVADLANPRWRNNVLNRKLSIALGGGTVAGFTFNLEKDFDISYNRKWFIS